jgi:hypothetical protein
LCHDKLDILSLKTRLIDFLAIILLLLNSFGSRSIVGMVVTLVGVVMSFVGVVVTCVRVSSSEVLGSGGLSLLVKILNLGLSKDATEWEY